MPINIYNPFETPVQQEERERQERDARVREQEAKRVQANKALAAGTGNVAIDPYGRPITYIPDPILRPSTTLPPVQSTVSTTPIAVSPSTVATPVPSQLPLDPFGREIEPPAITTVQGPSGQEAITTVNPYQILPPIAPEQLPSAAVELQFPQDPFGRDIDFIPDTRDQIERKTESELYSSTMQRVLSPAQTQYDILRASTETAGPPTGTFNRLKYHISNKLSDAEDIFGDRLEVRSTEYNNVLSSAAKIWADELDALPDNKKKRVKDDLFEFYKKNISGLGFGSFKFDSTQGNAGQLLSYFNSLNIDVPRIGAKTTRPLSDDLKKHAVDITSTALSKIYPNAEETAVKEVAIQILAEGFANIKRDLINNQGYSEQEADMAITIMLYRQKRIEEELNLFNVGRGPAGQQIPFTGDDLRIIEEKVDAEIVDRFGFIETDALAAGPGLGGKILGGILSVVEFALNAKVFSKIGLQAIGVPSVLLEEGPLAEEGELVSYNQLWETATPVGEAIATGGLEVVGTAALGGEIAFETLTGIPAKGKVSDTIKDSKFAHAVIADLTNPVGILTVAPFMWAGVPIKATRFVKSSQILSNLIGTGLEPTAARAAWKTLLTTIKTPADLAAFMAKAPVRTAQAIGKLSARSSTVKINDDVVELIRAFDSGERVSLKEVKKLAREMEVIYSPTARVEDIVESLRVKAAGDEFVTLRKAPVDDEFAELRATTVDPLAEVTLTPGGPSTAITIPAPLERVTVKAIPGAERTAVDVGVEPGLVTTGGDLTAADITREVPVVQGPLGDVRALSDDELLRTFDNILAGGVIKNISTEEQLRLFRLSLSKLPDKELATRQIELVNEIYRRGLQVSSVPGISEFTQGKRISGIGDVRLAGRETEFIPSHFTTRSGVISDEVAFNNVTKFVNEGGTAFKNPRGVIKLVRSSGDIFEDRVITTAFERGIASINPDGTIKLLIDKPPEELVTLFHGGSTLDDVLTEAGELQVKKPLWELQEAAEATARDIASRKGGEPVVRSVTVPRSSLEQLNSKIPLPSSKVTGKVIDTNVLTGVIEPSERLPFHPTPTELADDIASGKADIMGIQTEGRNVIDNPDLFDDKNTLHRQIGSVLAQVEVGKTYPKITLSRDLSPTEYADLLTSFRSAQGIDDTVTLGPTAFDSIIQPTSKATPTNKVFHIVIEDAKGFNIADASSRPPIFIDGEDVVTAGKFRIKSIKSTKNRTNVILTPADDQIFDVVTKYSDNILSASSEKRLAKSFDDVTAVDDASIAGGAGDGGLPPERTTIPGEPPLSPDPPETQLLRKIKTLEEFKQDIILTNDNLLGTMGRVISKGPKYQPGRVLVNMLDPNVLSLSDDALLEFSAFTRKHFTANTAIQVLEERMGFAERKLFKVEDNIVYVKRRRGWDKVVSNTGDIVPTPEAIIENPADFSLYIRKGSKEEEFVNLVRKVLDAQNDAENQIGIVKSTLFADADDVRHYFPRILIEAADEQAKNKVIQELGRNLPSFDTERGFQKQRHYASMAEGLDAGEKYANGFTKNVTTRLRSGQAAILDDEVLTMLKADNADISRVRQLIAESRTTNALPGVEQVDTINNILRGMVTGMDLGWQGLQLAPTIARNPQAALRAMLYGLEGIVTDGRHMARYLKGEIEKGYLVDFIQNGGIWNQVETSWEFAATKSNLSLFGWGPFGRFTKGFANTLNVAALENYKAMAGITDNLYAALGADKASKLISRAFNFGFKVEGNTAKQQAASVANKMTGRLETGLIGISKGQRQVEGAVFFAPRFQRATLGLFLDALQGGMRGAEARRTLGSLLATYYATSLLIEKVTGEGLQLDPTKPFFMTTKIATQHMGPAGPIVSFVKMLGAAYRNPESLTELSVEGMFKDNPITKRGGRAKFSPLIGLITDLAWGENYLGEKINIAKDPTGALLYFGSRITPFFIQSALEAGGKDTIENTRAILRGDKEAIDDAIAGALAEFFFGATVYPQSFKTKLGDTINAKYPDAMQRSSTGELNLEKPSHQELVRNDPELADLYERMRKDQREFFDDPDKPYSETREGIEDEKLSQLARRMKEGDPAAAQLWSDLRGSLFGELTGLAKGEDFPEPKTEEGKLMDAYYSLDYDQYKIAFGEELGPEKWAEDRETALQAIRENDPLDAIAIERRNSLKLEHNQEAENRFQAAKELKDTLETKFFPSHKGINTAEDQDYVDSTLKVLRQLTKDARIQGLEYLNPRTGKYKTQDTWYFWQLLSQTGEFDPELLEIARIILDGTEAEKQTIELNARNEWIMQHPELSFFYRSAWDMLTREEQLLWEELFVDTGIYLKVPKAIKEEKD